MNDSARNEVPPTINIGLLGYAFMGKSHSNGIRQINYMLADPPARAELTALCGRDEAALKAAAQPVRRPPHLHRLARYARFRRNPAPR